MKTVVLGALALALALVGVPAQADSTYGSTSGVSGVLYDDCVAQPFHYAVNLPADTQTWTLSVDVRGPDGQVADSPHLSDPEPMSGTSTVRLCPPTDLYGSYTIRAGLTWVDVDSVSHSSVLDDSSFTMRKPRTRTSLAVSTRRPAYGQVVAYRIRVWDERPAGYLATAFAWVHLEKRVHGRWVRMKGTRTLTHASGQVKLRLRYRGHHQRMRIRSVAETAPRFSRSVSPLVRLW